jgi:hypothetical protein
MEFNVTDSSKMKSNLWVWWRIFRKRQSIKLSFQLTKHWLSLSL